MIQNDEEKEWMLPLLELRDALDVTDDRPLRDFRRMNGKVQLFHDRPIPGPYTEAARHDWLRRLLDAQHWIRANGPDYVKTIELISMEELHEIRRIWVVEKHEIEDALPRIYETVTGDPFPGPTFDDVLVLSADDLGVLRELCADDRLRYELTRELLDVERQFRTMTRRAGLFDALERSFRRSYFDDEDDAVGLARRLRGDAVNEPDDVRVDFGG
jgi:DNA sulfur modification protein DndC